MRIGDFSNCFWQIAYCTNHFDNLYERMRAKECEPTDEIIGRRGQPGLWLFGIVPYIYGKDGVGVMILSLFHRYLSFWPDSILFSRALTFEGISLVWGNQASSKEQSREMKFLRKF